MAIMIRMGYPALAACAAVLLAACGGQGAGQDAQAQSTPSAVVAPQAETAATQSDATIAATPTMDATGAPAADEGSQLLADGSKVRVESEYLESGWLEGTLRPSPSGCRMVFLSKPTAGGYTMVALMTLKHIERQDGAAWTNVPVQPLLDREPSHCLQAAAD
jgi:hypothetical protein